MKSFIYILLTSLTFLVVGCQNESEEIRLINQAERLDMIQIYFTRN